MKKYLNILIIAFLVAVLLSILYEFKIHYEKKETVKNFCDNLIVDSKFNFNDRINNKNIFGSDKGFVYNERTSLGGFTCTVNFNNGIIVSKIFTGAGFIK